MKTTHKLKTLPRYFEVAWRGVKPWEVRKNDRNFQERDLIYLCEYSDAQGFTGRYIYGMITYIFEGHREIDFGLQDEYVIFTYTEIAKGDNLKEVQTL